MQKYLFKNISVVNEAKITVCDILVGNGIIQKIDATINTTENCREIDGEGLYLLPGLIDDQVHFREPGLTHKATIESESRAAVAGGVTSFMEMPNTIPNATTIKLLEEKYALASAASAANYSFYMGVTNDNYDEAMKVNTYKEHICGLKIFMGSSTGNMLVDDYNTLNKVFRDSELLIATHCEDERIIRKNYEELKAHKQHLEPADHPLIRNEEACFESSLVAVQFAQKYGSRLHVLHITTEKELQLFGNMLPLLDKRITCEVCVHHLHFTADDYATKGYLIKCNPAIKARHNKAALWHALLDNRIDVVATDHAPHLFSEKTGEYEHAHAGLPLVQHSLQLMLKYYKDGKISLEKIVEKMCHAVADCFQVYNRGYIREGFAADLVVVDLNAPQVVSKEHLLYKCGWSPLELEEMPATIRMTMVNGNPVYEHGKINESFKGSRLQFSRK